MVWAKTKIHLLPCRTDRVSNTHTHTHTHTHTNKQTNKQTTTTFQMIVYGGQCKAAVNHGVAITKRFGNAISNRNNFLFLTSKNYYF